MNPDNETALQPIDPEVQKCPYSYYAQLHEEGAAAKDEGPIGWVVPGHEDLSEIGRNTKRFSSQMYGEAGPTLTGVSPEPFSPEVEGLVGHGRGQDRPATLFRGVPAGCGRHGRVRVLRAARPGRHFTPLLWRCRSATACG